MAPDQVRKVLQAVPFRPFTVEIGGQRRVPVKHTDYAQLSPAGRTLVVFSDDDDAADIMNESHIQHAVSFIKNQEVDMT